MPVKQKFSNGLIYSNQYEEHYAAINIKHYRIKLEQCNDLQNWASAKEFIAVDANGNLGKYEVAGVMKDYTRNYELRVNSKCGKTFHYSKCWIAI